MELTQSDTPTVFSKKIPRASVKCDCRRPVLVVIYCVFCLQAALEAQVLDEKAKAQRLQTELDVSEQVQKDFVKLSQTLQVIIYTCVYMGGMGKPLMKMSELQKFLLCQK